MTIDLLTEIYSSFDPFRPPQKGAYVECNAVRGGWEVTEDLGRRVTRSTSPTCQLYSGHRGIGKSTELLSLKKYLEAEGYCVIYFAADTEDIEPQDAEYADILLACTRHLAEAIKLQKHNPLLNWMKERWESFKDLALTDVSFEGLTLEAQINQFAKITANLRATPDKRREIRRKINANTPSLVDAINDFIRQARESLPTGNKGICLIADNLDRIVETKEEGRQSNYDEIYLNRSEMLRGLDCHVIYTVPINVIYSKGRATQLDNSYDTTCVLPMIIVRNPDGTDNEAGIDKLRELVYKRVVLAAPELIHPQKGVENGWDLSRVFDSPDTLRLICIMSGGQVRNLMQLIQRAIDHIDELPITKKAAKRSIAAMRDTYRQTVQPHQWEILARVHYTSASNNDMEHLQLLRQRCLLEYKKYNDDADDMDVWCNVHPLIEKIPKFKEALSKVQSI